MPSYMPPLASITILPIIKGIMSSYFGGIQLHFRTTRFTTRWQDLEKGIITGYMISRILFTMGMNLLILTADREPQGSIIESGSCQHSIRGFIDDVTVTTATQLDADRMLTFTRTHSNRRKNEV